MILSPFLIYYLKLQLGTSMQESKSVLAREWETIYTSKDAKFVLVGNVEGYKMRAEGNHVVVINQTFPPPKENIISKKAREGKTVFFAFDSKLPNYTNLSNKEVMFHINLDEEEIITKQNTYKITENFFDKDGEQDEIEGHAHPVIIHTTPLCKNHSILAMYPDQELPQIIGQDIVLLLINMFKLFPNLKIGYNSIGAGAHANHLHFHLVFGQDIVGGPWLPLEKQKAVVWKKTSLINPKEQINLYSVGVQIDQFDGPIAQGFKLSPIGENLDASEIASSLSFVFGIVVNQLIELCIPHNILFSEKGSSIYIVLREFGQPKAIMTWLEFSGIIPINSESNYAIKQEQILAIKKRLRVDEKLISQVKKNVSKNLQGFI